MTQYPYYHIVVPGLKKKRNGGKMESLTFFYDLLRNIIRFSYERGRIQSYLYLPSTTLVIQICIFFNSRLGRLICAIGHDGTVDAVALMKSSAHKRLCISGARDRALIIWDVDTITVRVCYLIFLFHLNFMNLNSDFLLNS